MHGLKSGGAGHRLPLSSANEVPLLARICDNTHKELPARGAHLSLGVQGFLLGFSRGSL